MYLENRSRLALHAELEMAELTEAGAGGWKPVLQAAAVDGAQRPCTLARGQQLLLSPSIMADPTHGPLHY